MIAQYLHKLHNTYSGHKKNNAIMRTPLAQLELSSNLQKLNWAQIQRKT
jgi:hypothetical protein